MDATNTQMRKRTLAVCLAALIVTTSFAIVHTAAGRPHGGANAQNTTGDVIAQSRVATAGATIDSDATNESGRTAFRIENASMVSPDELGVWVSVTYPVSVGADVPRYIAFTAAINGKLVEKTFDVTGHTTPGLRWGKMSASGVGNEMFDGRGDLKPTTPLRINFTTERVPRFTDNVNFTLTGTAFASDEGSSNPSSILVTIPLPVIVVEGNPGPYVTPELFSAPMYYVMYKSLTDFLLNAGDGTFKYNAETKWSSYTTELQAHGYSTQQYVTLWDPRANFLCEPLIGYIDPQFYAHDAIKTDKDYTTRNDIIIPSLKADIEHIIRDHAESLSYASKVNLVGYSFGGPVVRWFASLDPQYVNMVVTVGAPHAGMAFFYEWIYNRMDTEALGTRYFLLSTLGTPSNDFVISSRQEAEQMMAVPKTAKPSVLYWLVPSYDCLVPPMYQPVDPYFHNTLNAPPASGVKYYNIYIDGPQSLQTDDQVYIKYVKDKNATGSFDWYKVTNITQGNGDGMILAKSAASFGDQYPTEVTNQPLSVRCYHLYMLDNSVIQGTIYRDLRGQ
ncbi:MAG TPA: alpha/beta fold hydrolase [Candidatus Acidoferrales bacterium]|nr:alpha/beta fold hydrolase [Candidatus Acidoferrales bacterium]